MANSFVQMQEINLIFFFIQPCILKYFFKCLQTEGNKERPWEFTPKIEKKLMFGKQDLQKKMTSSAVGVIVLKSLNVIPYIHTFTGFHIIF